MNDEDLLIENIFESKQKHKTKVDGKAKGDRTELNLCKFLTRFFGVEFTKALGSGSRGKQVVLPEHAKKTLTGDICVPEKFKWVIECKGGYEDDIDLSNALDGKPIPRLEEFIKQSSGDAEYCGRKPIILWKRNRKPWLALLQVKNISEIIPKFEYRFYYGNWIMVSLDNLFKTTERDFWFES